MEASVPGNLSIDVELPAPPPLAPNTNLPLPSKDIDDSQLMLNFVEEMKKSNTTADQVLDTLTNTYKMQEDHAKIADSSLEALASNAKSDINENPGERQKKKKIREYLGKKMVAADFFTSVGNSLKNIAKKVGGGILDILGALMIFALLGPEFLDSIIGFVLQTVMTLIEAFIGAIPTVIAAIVKWLPKVIDAVMTAIPKIWDALIKGFKSIANNELIPKPIREFFGLLADLGEFIGKVVNWAKDHLGVVITLLGVIVGMYIALQVVMGIYNLLLIAEAAAKALATLASSPFIIALAGIAAGMWAAIWPIALVVLGIAALIFIIYELYEHAEELSDWFDGLIDKFMNASGWVKALIGILALLFFPITMLIAEIYGIVKFFKAVKAAGGFKAYFIKMWEDLKKWFYTSFIPKILGIWDELKSKFSLGNILDAAKDMGKKIIDKIFGEGSFDRVTQMLKDARETIDKIVNGFLEDDLVKSILSWLKGKEDPDKNKKELTQNIGKLASGFSLDKGDDIANKLQSLDKEGLEAQIKALRGYGDSKSGAEADLLQAVADKLGPHQKASIDVLSKIHDTLKGMDNSKNGYIEPNEFKGLQVLSGT